jgi:hypothetical protein
MKRARPRGGWGVNPPMRSGRRPRLHPLRGGGEEKAPQGLSRPAGPGGIAGGTPAEGVAEKPEALERGGDFPLIIILLINKTRHYLLLKDSLLQKKKACNRLWQLQAFFFRRARREPGPPHSGRGAGAA